ncbi:MAG: AI-2E family transporter [Sphingomonadaceae bacterium]|nr:AI-2E family transporter [Sphingomonadaceae bacterium]
MRTWRFEDGGFLALILVITVAFAWLAVPFFGSILWGVIVAIVFRPVYLWLQTRLGGRSNLAAALCLLLILALVILPAFLLGISLIQEAADLYGRLQSGDINLAEMFDTVRNSLPDWADDLMVSAGWTDLAAARAIFGSSLATLLENIAGRALWFGQGALQLLASLGVMLYLAFFLLRDGLDVGRKVKHALPLRPSVRNQLIEHFLVVIRATMRGTVVVSVLQGLVGGLIFWLLGIDAPILWGLLMALFSLFPAVGTGVVWVPVAIYLLATGEYLDGGILVFCGLFVIGLIDNILRPILVGHQAKMPEFVVLISTVAGLKLMGLNGIVIGPIIAALFIAVWRIVASQRPFDEESAAN